MLVSASGFVLAGGSSRRMQTSKSLLPWQGSTLGRFVAQQVRDATGNVTIVGGGPEPGLRVIPDLFPGAGPAGGIVTALEDSTSEWSLIVACDMPGLDAAWLRQLLLAAAGSQIVVPRTADGRLHPLCAVWSRTALGAMRKAVTEGVYGVQQAIRPLSCHILEVSDPMLVVNVNTPEEWARFQEQAHRARE